MNEVYKEFFPKDPRARSAAEMKALALSDRSEIEIVTVIQISNILKSIRLLPVIN